MNIYDTVKRKIEILRGYPFFTDFMEFDEPDVKNFLDCLKAFSRQLVKKERFSKKELKLLQHLIALSTYPKEKRYTMLERWLTAELTSELISIELVRNPFSKDLKKLYKDFYQEVFPKDEQTPLRDYKLWMAISLFPAIDDLFSKNIYGHRVHERLYLLVVKIKGIVVGGAFFRTISTIETSFVLIDYILIRLQHLAEVEELKEFAKGEFKVKISLALFERCKSYAVKDAMRLGHKQPLFILAAANDPVRMYRKGILNPKYDVENPVLRLRLYSIMGFRFLDVPYVEPSLSEEAEPVDYLYAMIYSFSPQFRNEIESKIYKYVLVTNFGTWKDVDFSKEPLKGMLEHLDNLIRQGKMIKLMTFADLRIPLEVINACKEIRWKTED